MTCIVPVYVSTKGVSCCTAKKCGLKSKGWFSVILMKSKEGRFVEQFIKPTFYKYVTIHIYSSFFVDGIESNNVRSKSPFLLFQRFVDEVTPYGLCVFITPSFDGKVRKNTFPTIDAGFYFYRVRFVAEPAKVYRFGNHSKLLIGCKYKFYCFDKLYQKDVDNDQWSCCRQTS